MNHYNHMIDLINTLNRASKGKNTKLRLLRIILDRDTYLSTFTRTLRNGLEIKQLFEQENLHYYTVAGEFLINFMSDELEDSLYSLSNNEKQKLIQRINNFLIP